MSTLRNRTKAEPQRSGMTHAKWREVQSIAKKSKARYVYGSVIGKSGTYNVGRNEAKRAKARVLAEAIAENNRLTRAA